MEIFYWPALNQLTCGFITLYINQLPGRISLVSSFFLGGLILWDLLFRSQQSVSLAFVEEIWSRNLLNLFASPLRPSEFLCSTMILSLAKLALSGALTLLLAHLLYSYEMLWMGLALFMFISQVVWMGWSLGILNVGILLRFGEKAEIWIWGLPILLQPFSSVFYPVDSLPRWARIIAKAVPATYVFEGMREVIQGNPLPWKLLSLSLLLNGIYFAFSVVFFQRMFHQARLRGLLYKIGE